MAVNKEDQNTFILIGVILIICLIAIVAILSGIWALVRDPVTRVGNEIGEFIRTNRVYDFNFTIPTSAFLKVEEETKPLPLPVENKNQQFKTFDNAILSNEELTRIDRGEKVEIPSLRILINKLNINSQIVQGNDSDTLLKEGFWVAPISNPLGKGQVLFFCHRTYFGVNDPRSCWFIDRLVQGDDIVIQVENEEAKYKVLSTTIVDANDELIYQLDSEKDLIKIVTFTPRETGEKRLEIIATRVG